MTPIFKDNDGIAFIVSNLIALIIMLVLFCNKISINICTIAYCLIMLGLMAIYVFWIQNKINKSDD